MAGAKPEADSSTWRAHRFPRAPCGAAANRENGAGQVRDRIRLARPQEDFMIAPRIRILFDETTIAQRIDE
ncbi:hypothetical protein ABTM57_19810, partial [Acinetobacter baumannii]